MARFIDTLKVYGDRRVLSIFFFGFSSGLPLLLTGATLSAWLRDDGVTLTEIGVISLVGLAYGLKFLWAPIVDHVNLPVLTRLLGRRRSWLLVSQVGLIGTIVGMAKTSPDTAEGLRQTIYWAIAVAFASATQDIVIDAYRTEILSKNQLGAGAATIQFGYRIGMLVAGGGALIVADYAGWQTAYLVMGALLVAGIITTLVNPEPAMRHAPAGSVADKSGDRVRGTQSFLPNWLAESIDKFITSAVGPFVEFSRRPGFLAILAFVGLYRYGESLLGVMANPFYLDIGFTKAEIGWVSKIWGLAMTLAGTAAGGLLVARIGILRSLMIGGFLQAASHILFTIQAIVGHSVPMLAVTIGVENLTAGMASGAFVAYLSSLCSIAFTATQYALLSSLAAFIGKILASGGGWLADRVSWATYFMLTIIAAIPGLLLLIYMIRKYPPPSVEDSDALT